MRISKAQEFKQAFSPVRYICNQGRYHRSDCFRQRISIGLCGVQGKFNQPTGYITAYRLFKGGHTGIFNDRFTRWSESAGEQTYKHLSPI